ncbi:unnamed protein product, partial [marine sediment metagenome]
GLTIWLEVAAEVISTRISQDSSRAEHEMDIKELIQRIKLRDSADRERLEEFYGISFQDKKNFNVILRNEGYSLEKLKEKIKNILNENFPPPEQN